MYKILIVDDEYYFREALKISFPWEKLGFQIVGEAKNGEDALEQMSSLHPDVVMVDINMPIMGGLEFIEQAQANGYESEYILLTGHSEFSYAKHALQLGVFNYVLKPIDEEEIQKSLLELKAHMDDKRSEKLELDQLKRQVEEKVPLIRNQYLNDWLLGKRSADPFRIIENLQDLDIDLIAPYYQVAVVDIDTDDQHPISGPDKRLINDAIQVHVQEFAGRSMKCIECFDDHDRLVLIFGSDTHQLEQIHELCDSLRKAVQEAFAHTVSIGVGNGYTGVDRVSVSYKEALYALKHRLILGANQLILYSRIDEIARKVSLFSVEQKSKLLMNLRTGNEEEIENWLSHFFRNARMKNASIEMVFVAGLEIVSTCLEFLEERSQSTNEVLQNQSQPDLFQQIQQMNSFSELEQWIRSLVDQVIKHAHNNKMSRSAKLVEEVKTYIENNYRNDALRIEDIAKSVHVNYNHLCYVFKKETSLTINEYLIELRMAKAKDLFDQGWQVVQEVAYQVGYSDANYFGKCFKKYIGISPSKYIENVSV